MLNTLKYKYKFTYLYNALRALQYVRSVEGETKIFECLNYIQSIPLCPKRKNTPHFQLAVSQKLFWECTDTGLATAVMLSRYKYNKPLILPYPKQWRNYLESIGLINHRLSKIYFYKMIFYKLIEGIKEYCLLLKKSIHDNSEKKIDFTNYVLFLGFPENALKLRNNNIKLDNFMSYTKEKYKDKNLVYYGLQSKHIASGCFTTTYLFCPLNNFTQITNFLFTGAMMVLKAILSLVLGQWSRAYMLKDEMLAKYIDYLPREALPNEVVFSNSYYVYKPLWAQKLEKLNKKVVLLFYATNTYNIETKKTEYGMYPAYSHMTWSNYYTFHENHKKFLQSVCKNSHVHVEESAINLVDKSKSISLPNGTKIAVFDVLPFRDAFLAKIGRPTTLYDFPTSKQFLLDILSWCEKNKTYLILKTKRNVKNRSCPKYSRMLKKLSSNKWFIIVDSQYSPRTVSSQVDAVICQPFTSAAISAKEVCKLVAYYDATGELKQNQLACQGVRLLDDKLKLWEYLDRNIEVISKT